MGPLPVGIIADDITGAADTAAKFARPGAFVPVSLSSGSPSAGVRAAFAVTTDSRACPPDIARDRVVAAARAVLEGGAGLIYKKVDSNMRGNIGAELAGLRDAGLAPILLCPAFPDRGRTVVRGLAVVDGVLVAETEMGRDPEAPVAHSRIADILLSQSDSLRIAHLFLDHPWTGDSLSGLLSGCDVVIADAETTADLEAIASAALWLSPPPTLAGSAGLAGAVARHLLGPLARPSWPDDRDGPVFAVLASSSQRLAEQLQAARPSVTLIALACANLTWEDELLPELNEAISQAVCELRAGRDAVVHAAGPLPAVPSPVGLVVEQLAHLAYVVVRQARPKGLLVGGGATAQAVLAALGVRSLGIDDEPLPGIAAGEAVGGEFDGLPIVLKPGAAGGKAALVELIHYLGRRVRALEVRG